MLSLAMTETDVRARFDELVAQLRPELHRYCARMAGSVADGEDIVQDTLERAMIALDQLDPAALPPLRPWLFRIAHNRAIDHGRSYARRMAEPLDAAPLADPAITAADDALAGADAVRIAIARFLELPPLPRSCVILKDVLGASLDEIAGYLELRLPAVKAALHRGRVRLRELGDAARAEPAPGVPSPVVARYAALFNARDWDAVRAMLADDVRLDITLRATRVGRREVGLYFTNYDAHHDWQLAPAWLDGREVLAVPASATRPAYFIELVVTGDRIAAIRDFRYLGYIVRDARFVP